MPDKNYTVVDSILTKLNLHRMKFSIIVTTILYIILFLALFLYSIFFKGKEEPIGASIIYLNLNTGRERSSIESDSLVPKKVENNLEKQIVKKKSETKKSQDNQYVESIKTVDAVLPPIDAKRVTKKSSTSYKKVETIADSVPQKTNYREAGKSTATPSESSMIADRDWDKISENIVGEQSSKKPVSGASANSGGKVISNSILDIDSLNTSRRLLKKVDPNLDNVDTAERKMFSFIIMFDIMPNGGVASVFVIESSGSTVADKEMEKAVRQWQFESVGDSRNVNVKLKYYVRVK